MAFDLLAPFTGSAYDQAAQQQRDYFTNLSSQVNANIATAQNQGLGALQSGQYNAIGAISPAITAAQNYITGGVGPSTAALYAGQGAGAGALGAGETGGLAALQSGVGTATAAYNPLQSLTNQYGAFTNQASNASADALGLNGPEGVARAQASFQASPGYQFQLSQGLDSIVRAQNAAGMAASGNTSRDAQVYGQGIATQEGNNYLNQLNTRQQTYAPLTESGAATAGTGIANAALTGGTGAANIYTGTGGALSSLYSGTGAGLAGLYSNAASSLANLSQTGGLAEADVYNQNAAQQAALIQSMTGLGTQFASNIAPQYASTYGAQAAATTAGASNLWNLGLQGIKLAGGAGYLPTGTNPLLFGSTSKQS